MRRHLGLAGFRTISFVIALITAVAAGTAFATYIERAKPLPFAATSSVIKACKLNSTGALRIPSGSTCKKGETLMTWNQQGPQGAQGAAGSNAPGITTLEQLVGLSCGSGQGTVSIVEDAHHSDKYLLKCNIPDTTCPVANGTGTCNHYGDVTAIVCNTNFADADANLATGCETNLLVSMQHCGSVGNSVPLVAANATTACVNGVPTITCNTNYANADNVISNGCEVNLMSDLMNCGSVGRSLVEVPHGYPRCYNGNFIIDSCSYGYTDADGIAVNGCEVSLLTDPLNCGSVGNVVPAVANATSGCTGGHASYTCNAGWANVDGNWATGCEVNLMTSPTNCGSIGNVVPAVAHALSFCLNGSPSYLCLTGWANTNGLWADGCEAVVP